MVHELFFGDTSDTISSVLILLMLILMLTMSVRLMLSRRKKAYYSLTFSLFLVALQYTIIIILGNRPGAQTGGIEHYLIQGLQVISFILTNVGLYQMYNATKRRILVFAYAATFLVFAIMAARYHLSTRMLEGFESVSDAAAGQTYAFLNVWMDLYLYGLIFFCFYFITPYVGQTIKYQIALVVYFLTHSAHVLNNYVYGEEIQFLTSLERFLPVVYFFFIFQFIFERMLELMQAVYQSSITDGLTGLYNRRHFTKRLEQCVNYGMKVSVIFSDIDNFKRLNDTEGHQRGDEALQHVASIAIDTAESIGIAGRYGGEEIVMLITDSNEPSAAIAERLRRRVEAETGVTVSVGWSRWRKGISAEQLLKQADEAMYLSKTSGKNRVSGYAENSGRRVSEQY